MRVSYKIIELVPPPREWTITLTDNEIQELMVRYTVVNSQGRFVRNEVQDQFIRNILRSLIDQGAAVEDRKGHVSK